MTFKELMEKLNEMIENGEIDENSNIEIKMEDSEWGFEKITSIEVYDDFVGIA